MFEPFSEAEALQKAQGALGLQKGVRCVRTSFVALYVALTRNLFQFGKLNCFLWLQLQT